ncbi:hypothetical protein N7520_001453 [Penicillium odoratum]|uniref:uncharacterized protein n=1 Tax=Penicillium odoratum TaxID=1167516 RepID=UPI0025496255|nr:uncharacterized protein N7520_001453 [Penicillium odoratum]KAJ5778207.1 hypothetical protein N7520_001453 [Penicillium odoratum]
MSSSRNGDSVPNDTQQTNQTGESESSGILGGVTDQLNSMTGSSSISEIPGKATAVAGEKVAAVKETIIDSAVPAAGEALQNLGSQVRKLAGKAEETIEEDLDLERHSEQIDKMDTERLCDFLREKHKSTVSSLPTN